jgi:carbon storage regulator
LPPVFVDSHDANDSPFASQSASQQQTASAFGGRQGGLTMLVLTRRESEGIALGDDIVVTIVSIQGNKVRLGISAPDQVKIRRCELLFELADAPTAGRRVVERV